MDHDFGKHLQKARTDRGLSIEQAAAAVRIRSTFLRALESSDLTKFPNAAYAKSFLLMYGKFLGVDLKSIAAMIDTTTQMKVEGYQYPDEPGRRAAEDEGGTGAGIQCGTAAEIVGLMASAPRPRRHRRLRRARLCRLEQREPPRRSAALGAAEGRGSRRGWDIR